MPVEMTTYGEGVGILLEGLVPVAAFRMKTAGLSWTARWV